MSIKKKIKKGDEVIVITGKDKGSYGRVIKVLPSENKAVVSGVNLVKKHQKPTKDTEGGIIQREMPLDISNIAFMDPETKKPAKVGFKFLETGKKVRFSKLSGKILDEEGK